MGLGMTIDLLRRVRVLQGRRSPQRVKMIDDVGSHLLSDVKDPVDGSVEGSEHRDRQRRKDVAIRRCSNL
jgi:hypothetical protein